MKKRIALLLAVATMTVFAGCGVVGERTKHESISYRDHKSGEIVEFRMSE